MMRWVANKRRAPYLAEKSKIEDTGIVKVLTRVIMMFFLLQPRAEANEMKEFSTSAVYGVLAGTLVGAASLAFTDKPGDNLNMIARGASLGLYAGILLGLYVVYLVPSPGEVYQEPEPYPVLPPEELPEGVRFQVPSLSPIISQNRVDGLFIQSALTF
jgi:hypothetical protein